MARVDRRIKCEVVFGTVCDDRERKGSRVRGSREGNMKSKGRG
jgi:hypothetical protein